MLLNLNKKLKGVFLVCALAFMQACNSATLSNPLEIKNTQEYMFALDKKLSNYYGAYFSSCLNGAPYPIALKNDVQNFADRGLKAEIIKSFDLSILENDAVAKCSEIKQRIAYDTIKQSLSIIPGSSITEIPDIFYYISDGTDAVGRKMDRVEVILSGVGIALDFMNLDIANPRFFRKIVSGSFATTEDQVVFLRNGENILKYYPRTSNITASSADEFLELLGKKLTQSDKIIVEIGTGNRIADFSHLVDDVNGFYIGFDGSDRVIKSMSDPQNILSYSNKNNIFVGDVLSELKSAGKNVYIQQAMGYGSGLALALSYLDGTPRWVAVGGDALVDLGVARFSGVKGGKIYEEYLLNIYSEKTGRIASYDDFVKFYDDFKNNRLNQQEKQNFLNFKKSLIENLPEYYEKIGIKANFRFLSHDEIRYLGTKWAYRCARVDDLVGLVIIQ